MKKLVTDCWLKFYDEKNKRFKGEMFEALIETLLIQQYGINVWQATSQTWDGKKDFYREYFLDNKKVYDWAECKMYQNALSINILTPTLIMSTLNPVNEITFFSYSPLNQNAKNLLCEFADTHHKKVKIYDDEKLEDLIIELLDFDILNDYFCNLSSDLSNNENDIISCKENIHLPLLEETYTADAFEKCTVKLFEVLELSVIIENLTSKTHNITCILDLDSFYHFFEGTDKKMCYKEQRILFPGEIIEINFPVRIIKYAERLQLPSVNVYLDNKFFDKLETQCKMSGLIKAPFIGHQNDLDDLEAAFSRKSFSILCLYGRSGVGKTRFLKEIQSRYAMNRSNTIFISSQQVNKYCLTWLKKVFSHLFVLPLVQVENLNCNFSKNTDMEVVTSLLYNGDFEFTVYYSILAKILLNKLSETNTMLLIDNVQDYDSNTITFLNELLNYSDMNLNKQLVLTFNQDLLANNSSALQLLERIKVLEKDDPIRNKCIKLKNFQSEHATLYIKHCLGLSYDKRNSLLNNVYIIETMFQITKGNPLFLEQLMIGFFQENIITYQQGLYLISDNSRLYSYLKSVPDNINDYFNKRLKKIQKTYANKWKQIKEAICVLTFFENISFALLEDIIHDDCVLDILFTIGIFKMEDSISFYHPLIFKFFHSKQYSMSKNLMKRTYQCIASNCLISRYPAQYYISYMSCNKCSKALLKTAVEELLIKHIPPEYVIRYSGILLERLSINNSFELLNIKLLINYYTGYCYSSVRTDTYLEALKKYSQIYNYLKMYNCFQSSGFAYGNFIINYQNTLLTNNENYAVIQLGEEFLENINTFSFSDGESEKICASIRNRLHVAYNRVEKHLKSLPYSKNAYNNLSLALEYAFENNDKRRMIQNKIDFGNMYFLANINLECAFSAWKDAENIYLQSTETLKNLLEQIYFHTAIIYTLNHNYEAALTNIDDICSDYIKNLPNPFYYIKANLLKITINIMLQQWDEAENLLAVAEEICQTYNFTKGHLVCTIFHAILEECYLFNTENACFYYLKAFEQLSYLQKTSVEQENEFSYFTYLAAKIKSLGEILSENQYYPKIKSRSLRKQLYNIFNCSECNKETLLAPFLYQKLQYWCENLKVNLPKII